MSLQRVRFEEVPVAEFFKETKSGAWHLKTERTRGTYHSSGVRGEVDFDLDERVYISTDKPTAH